ncbi:endonuclease III 1 [Thraustotheca clavata]|uniref:Endonuclease III homolog n=1 Tax=Thraustotheca clavata TaxID=74557 RepID=A0A1W0A8A4_9STRA|nr:endonuclease III 1 [Thraustotheca clavata]
MQLRSRTVVEAKHILQAKKASSKRAIVSSGTVKQEQIEPQVSVKLEHEVPIKKEQVNVTKERIKVKKEIKRKVKEEEIKLQKLEIEDKPIKKQKAVPEHWEEVWDGIAAMRAQKTAAVDSQGCESFNDLSLEPNVRRFHVLVASMLSSQTKDPVTAAAMERLKEHGLTVENILATEKAKLAQILRPVGFFNNKATYLHKTCTILRDQYNSDIPSTFDELIALPGVGPKMAHLTMSAAWEKTVGICVDVHVHRISNRLGWVKTWNKQNPKSQDPEKTRKELEDWLPYDRWNPINAMLVGFGQEICFPVNPRCSDCTVRHLCPSASKK